MLNNILKKGLSQISEEERSDIFNRWIRIKQPTIFESKIFWITVSTILVIAIVPWITISTWNRSLKRMVTEKTAALELELLERKKVAAGLRESEKRFRRMIENLPVGAAYIEGEKVYFNNETEQITGYKPSEFQTLTQWFQIMYGEDHKTVRSNYEEDVKAGFPSSRVLSLKRKGGQIRYVEFTAYQIEGGHIWIFQDITQRKQAEEKLKESESRFRTIFEQAAVGVALIESKTGRFLRINQRYCDMLGYTISEMSDGKTFHDITYSEDLQTDLENMRRLVAGEIREFTIEKRYCHKNGAIVWVSLTVSPTWEIGADPHHHIAVVVDITRRKEIELRIQKSLKEKEVMLKEIHHRVKNNLQMVESLLNLQLSEISDPNSISPLQDSKHRVRSMALVHETLYQSGNFVEIEIKTYLEQLIHPLLTSMRPLNADINVSYDIDDISLEIDTAIACGLIVNELVNNSLKHAFCEKTAGNIKIHMKRVSNERVVMQIADDGIGMPLEKYSGDIETLGLQIVKLMAEKQLEGEIELAVRDGVSFNISFPVLKDSPDEFRS